MVHLDMSEYVCVMGKRMKHFVLRDSLLIMSVFLISTFPINAGWWQDVDFSQEGIESSRGLTPEERVKLCNRVEKALSENDIEEIQEIFDGIKARELLDVFTREHIKFCCQAKTPQAVDVLVEYLGVPCYRREQRYTTGLLKAPEQVIRHMITRGFDINYCDLNSSTIIYDSIFSLRSALRILPMNQIIDRLTLFLAYGADPGIKSDESQKTAFQLASEFGYTDIVALFERQQKILGLLKANKAPSVISLLLKNKLHSKL